MGKHKIDDLRDHLFDTLKALKDKASPMEIDRARAIADVAKVIVESAKVEVDYLRVTEGIAGTGFIPEGHVPPARQLPANATPAAREQAARLDRIDRIAPPPSASVNGEEFESVWNGGEGLTSIGRTVKRA